MLVLEEGKEFSLEGDYKEWADHTPSRGAVIEIHLPDTDYEPAPEVSVGFLVMESAIGRDGSAGVEVKYLGGGDKDLGKEFSGIFNRRTGYIHLCSGKPCFEEEEYGLHTTRYKIFTVNGCDRPYMTPSVHRQINKWLGPPKGPAEISRPKVKAKRGKAVGDPPSLGKKEEVAGLRDKLESLRKRLASKKSVVAPGAPGTGDAGGVEEVPSSSEDIPSPTPPGDQILETGTMLTASPWDSMILAEKKGKRKKRTSSKIPTQTDGNRGKTKGGRQTPMAIRDGSTGDYQSQLALKAAAVAGETPGGARGHRRSRSSRVGKELMKILTRSSRRGKKDKKKKRRKKEGRRSRKGSAVKPDPDGSSSPVGSSSSEDYSSSSWDGEATSSEEKELDPPLRKRSKQSPGSVLKLLLAHARTQLDQSAKVALDPQEAQRITEGVKMGSYFSICIRPSMGNAMGPIRELHHLSTAIDLLRQGSLNLLGDMLASRFMAIHQASVDGNWTAAKHMELFPLEDSSAATSAVLLETRRHAKLAAKAAGLDVSGWYKGGRGKGNWKGKNPGGQDTDLDLGGKDRGKKGKGKKKGGQQGWWMDQENANKWKDKQDNSAEKKA